MYTVEWSVELCMNGDTTIHQQGMVSDNIMLLFVSFHFVFMKRLNRPMDHLSICFILNHSDRMEEKRWCLNQMIVVGLLTCKESGLFFKSMSSQNFSRFGHHFRRLALLNSNHTTNAILTPESVK